MTSSVQMRAYRNLSLIGPIVVLFGVPGCQSKTDDAAEQIVIEESSMPVVDDGPLEFRQPVVDLGVIESPSVSHAFEFINRGNDPVRVTATTSTCACTVLDLAKKVFSYQEQGAIQATVNLRGRAPGQQRFALNVAYESNGVSRQTGLAIHLEYRPPIEVFPTELDIAVFGDAPSEGTLTILSSEDGGSLVQSVECSVPWVRATASDEPGLVKDRWVQHYDVEVLPSQEVAIGRTVSVSLTFSPDLVISVPVRVTTVQRVLVLPRRGVMRVEQRDPNSFVAELFVRDREGAPVQIESISAPKGVDLAIHFDKEPAARHEVQVSMPIEAVDVQHFPIQLLVQIVKPCRQESNILLLPPSLPSP